MSGDSQDRAGGEVGDGGPGRRAVLEAAGVTLVAGVVGYVGMTALAPRGDGDGGYGGTGDGDRVDDESDEDDGDRGDDGREKGGDDDRGDAAGDGDGQTLLAVTDVPDGGGVVLDGRRLVLVRDGDDVHAFTAVCTHQGCLVGGVTGGEIRCPCHGSAFDARTGAVVRGPATADLDEVDVQVRDGRVVLR
ncbi:Rieske (2Fe-2S) protein [Cellulomonas fimi]|uniref:Cytochrome bc1 complex Rieske iron-sulfur subunit n=1 Tax=Cellulomonas fimi (strain ATCC 484 / DSM 20113 / JCM 1341 / CCUG 24087 / LMG 16345 / NBRC 15513 / NCIMB 8980 / NCTC 7547 / NRS-133) TaxID=590998 RepID=F4H411_CELFA|nr:Rieske (2Fe-2S) protein [Cellulomonas fimi]AEE45363.1 Rieske (2Fe-2S) iron-sulfur domain protein [Cellulomonas fimi ATCC 484]VEH29114.1 Cytochrome b6-f complex iron-sulfur subunit [Cellulomonas fimi]